MAIMEITNRVANSGLVTLDLERYYHTSERILFDMSELLHEGLILREKEFRQFVKDHQWQQYQDKSVAVYCSSDAIVPSWAYMLLCAVLEPYAHMVVYGNLEALELALYRQAFESLDLASYKEAKVVIKGCSNKPVPLAVYVELTRLLRPVVSSIMYGEPCSTVPVYKARNVALR